MLNQDGREPIAVAGYQLIRLLGEGGAGTVYKARQQSTGQIVALKLLRGCAGQDAARARRLAERFERETQLCGQLHHPHLVRLLDKGTTASMQLYAVFEFVPGETLKELLQRKGAMNAALAGELMGQVLDALACAHAQGIAHRDLKPHNIMITTTGARTHAKVLDFGIAAFVAERQHGEARGVTLTQETMCSPSYSAPEQLRGEPPSVKSDLYAWGLVLLECLTGQPAVQGVTLAAIFHQQLSAAEIALPPALLGHPLGGLLRRVLRKNPLDRAESACAVHADFLQLNLAGIVGPLGGQKAEAGAAGGLTAPYHPGAAAPAYERRQITVLCCTLFLSSTSEHELEASEALQRDQIGLCIDTAVRYGGHVAGALGAGLMMYFGYPQPSDSAARRAARTALELVSQARRRAPLLELQGFRLSIRLGIHTGMVLVRPGYLPGGSTPNTALLLEQAAPPGTVMVSLAARRMLDPYIECDAAGFCHADPGAAPLPMYALAGEYPAEAAQSWRGGGVRAALVGRGAELARLDQVWHAARAGRGNAILIQGEAGIGKSRLAAELAIAARAAGHAAPECRCLPEHRNQALRPFLDLVKNHWRLHDGDAPDVAAERLRAALGRCGPVSPWALPILCSWLGLPLPPAGADMPLSAERQKQVLLEALRGLVLQMGDGQPFVLVIEDVHWIDQTSFELLGALLPALGGQALLLALTARPEFDSPWEAARVPVLALARLAQDDAGQLVGDLLSGARLDDSALRYLLERSDGVPLFVEELTRTLVEHKLLVAEDGVYRLAGGADTAAIPVTLRDLLAARLAGMGGARETAQLAAAIGREFAHALLVEVALVDEASLQADLDALIAADLINRRRRVQGDSYVFRHALIRDAAYDALPRAVQRQTHARIARRLAGGTQAEVEAALAELARHHAAADEFSSAVAYGNRAARALLERALHDDAIELATRVEQWSTRIDGAARREADLASAITLTNALMSKYGWANGRVRSLAERTLGLAEASPDPRQRVPILWMLAFYHHVASNRATVRQLVAQLDLLCVKAAGDGLDVAAATLRGVANWIDGDLAGARAAFVMAIDGYDAQAHAGHAYQFGLDTRVWASAGLAQVLWFAGADQADEAAALALAHTALGHARTLRHIPSIGVALMYLCFLHQYRGDLDATRAVSAEMLELAGKYGLPAVQGYAAAMNSWACSDLARTEQVLDALGRTGCMLGLSYLGAMAAQLHERAGDSAGALARIEQSLALCDQVEERYFKPEMLRQRAHYRGSAGPAARAASCADLELAIVLARAGGMGRSLREAQRALDALRAARRAPGMATINAVKFVQPQE
ncbi:TOMM system kinase/cyclase fusion protein [Massilia mucilaginosa]|uniref:TOMM system kinase/cyclase fusion protein n=1 Tax=Massilia mucilaginosa TaxID=2609282 RepID=UPI001422CF71